MAVLRYFHQDPKQVAVKESSVIDNRGTTLTNKITNINTSITNNTEAIDSKQDAIPGKTFSSNDFTNYYKKKLEQIEEGAEVNVQADWGENDNTADSYIQNKPSIDTVVTEDSNNLITSGAVFNAIDELPEPMIFKGSLGVNGTILTLPTAASGNTGYVYKVITAGTYNGLYAEPGDTFISDGTQWIHIPSGDEPNGTVTNVAMTVPTGLEVSGTPITTSGTLAITYALGYAIPTLTKQAEWDAKQDAISDLSTIRSNASYGATAYGWGDHSQAGYQMAISDLSTIRSNAGLGATAYGWGNHALAGYLPAISDLATIRSRADEGHTAYGWGNHANAGYVKSSGVTSVAMTVPTGLSISGSPITSTGTLALSFANGYSIPTTAKQSNWDTAYGWGNHANAGYVKSSGVTSVTMTVPIGFSVTGSPITSTGTLALAFASGYSLPTTAKLSNWDTAYGWGDHSTQGYLKSITKAMVTTALGYTPPTTDTNTTYTIATGDSDGQIKVTPSSGSAYNVSVKGLGSRAYDSTAYLPLAGGTMSGTPYINMPANSATIANSLPFGITYGKIQCYDSLKIAADTDGSTTEYTFITAGYGTENCTAANGLAIGYNTLTWKNNAIWHAGNLTNLNLLTNGPGYITGITKSMVTTALGYTPPTLDTNTTYGAGTGLSLSGTTFSVKTGYTTNGNNRAVQADSNGNLYVVQKDDNTTYNFSGTSFTSGKLDTGEHNANNITTNGNWYYTSNGPSTSLGATTDDGALYSLAYSINLVGQIAQDYRNGNLFTRGKNGGTWQSWRKVMYTGDALTKSLVTTALGYTPPTTDTNTTYSIATGDSNGLIKVTPSSGSAYNVSVKGLGARAYDSTNYLPLTGGTLTGDLSHKSSHDLAAANNGISSTIYPTTFNIFDAASRISVRLENVVTTTTNGFYLYARSYNSGGALIAQRGLKYTLSKPDASNNVTGTWGVDDAASFRTALGLGARATDSTNYLPLSGGTMTGTIISPGNDSVAMRPAVNGNDYIGSSSYRYWMVYALDLHGNLKDTNTTSLNLYPQTTNTYSCGTSGNTWKYIYGRYVNALDIAGTGTITINNTTKSCLWILSDGEGVTMIGNDGGRVGIGNLSTPSYQLHVAGACAATSHPTTSDERLKDIKTNISIPIEDIANAPLFLFNWKNGADSLTHVGSSAQYWQEKVPELVSEADDNIGTLSLEYEVLGTASSISIAKEVVSLKEEIKLLQALIAELKLLLNK